MLKLATLLAALLATSPTSSGLDDLACGTEESATWTRQSVTYSGAAANTHTIDDAIEDMQTEVNVDYDCAWCAMPHPHTSSLYECYAWWEVTYSSSAAIYTQGVNPLTGETEECLTFVFSSVQLNYGCQNCFS